MLEKYLRPTYQFCLVNPIAKILLRLFPLNPTIWTLFGCLVGVLAAIFVSFGFTWRAVICLLISGYFDTLDGTLARAAGKTSPLGTIFDIVADRIVEFAVILGLFLVDPMRRGLISLFMLGAILICVTSFLVVGIFSQNETHKNFYYSPGLIERPEAFCFFIAMILFPSLFFILGALFTFLVFTTTALRIRQYAKR